MITRQNEIYSILGISWGEQSSPASPAPRTRQEEIFDILSFPAISRRTSPNDVGATLAVARPQGSPTGGAGVSPPTETKPMGYGGGGTAGGGGGRDGRADERTALQEQLNELDEAAAYVTTTEQSDGIERQRRPLIEQLRRMDEEEGKSGVYTAGDRLKNAGANAKLMVQQGLTIADHNIAQTADWLFGGIAKEGRALLNTTLQSINPEWGFENDEALITQYNKRGEEVLAHNQAIAEKRIEEKKLNPTAWKYGPQVVAAVPDAVLAVLTYGSSAAPQATTKGLEVASRLAQGGKLYQKVAPLVQSTLDMMRSPQWLSAFARSAGTSYETALADGTSEELATLYALANGYANATIEVGGGDEALGGIQKLPKQLQDLIRQGNSNKLLLWAKSTLNEAGEEVWQGLTEKGLRGIYTDEVPLYSQTDENAVINPNRMKEEAKGGFVVGGILSGGQTTAQSLGTAIKAPAGNNVPLQQNIDNAAQQRYTEDNKELNGGNIGGSETGTGAETAEAYTGERTPGLPETNQTLASGGNDGRGNHGLVGYAVSENAKNALSRKGVADVGVIYTDADGAFFASAMEQAAATQRFGASVDLKTAENIAEIVADGGHAFIAENGSGGVVVTGDGDIEGVFKNRQTGNASTFANLMICAIENDGVKLDCYGLKLVNGYERFGFIPVAQVNFDKNQVNERWDFETQGTPQIYFMLYSGKGAVDTIANMDTVHLSTQKELDVLPEMDYDSAYAYRDRLLAERSSKGSPLGGAVERSETEGGTTAAEAAANTDPTEAARQQQYQTETAAALRAGDYQRALALFKEFGNPNLRALNDLQTLKVFTEFADAMGYGPAMDTAVSTDEINSFEEYLRQNFSAYKLEGGLSHKNDWSKTTARTVTSEEKEEIIRYAKDKRVEVGDIDAFDGDPELLKAEIDIINRLSEEYGLKNTVTISSKELEDSDFAETLGHSITFNSKALRDRATTEYNISYGNYFASKTVEDIALHEMGHIIAAEYNINGLAIAKRAFYNIYNRYYSPQMLRVLLKEHVSYYSSTDSAEIIAEVIVVNKNGSNEFTEFFVLLMEKEMLE